MENNGNPYVKDGIYVNAFAQIEITDNMITKPVAFDTGMCTFGPTVSGLSLGGGVLYFRGLDVDFQYVCLIFYWSPQPSRAHPDHNNNTVSAMQSISYYTFQASHCKAV